MSASTFKVTNMISFVDRNKCMIDGRTEDVMKLEPFADKWRSFGFIVKEVDGHNFKELCDAIDFALENKTDSPVMIIADTIKAPASTSWRITISGTTALLTKRSIRKL